MNCIKRLDIKAPVEFFDRLLKNKQRFTIASDLIESLNYSFKE